MSSVDILLKVAEASLGAGEQPPSSNAGPFVELCQKATGNRKGDPWCASWVSRMGRIAYETKWPVPMTGGVMVMSDWAVRTKCRLLPKAGPKPGDLFILWYPKMNRWAHVGIVWKVNADGSIVTLEGNTSQPGDNDPARSREGWLVASKTRKLTEKDRLIRWTQQVK